MKTDPTGSTNTLWSPGWGGDAELKHVEQEWERERGAEQGSSVSLLRWCVQ